MWIFHSRDSYLRGWILAWLLIDSSPLIFRSPDWSYWAPYLGTALLLPIAGLALVASRQQQPAPERRFWTLIVVGIGFWWIASLLLLVDMWRGASTGLSVATDCFYSLLYLALFLALETRADGETGFPGTPGRRLEGFGAIALVASLCAYFVVIPAVFDPARYSTAVPSLIFYLALDLFLAARFGRRALRVESRRWRFIYSGLFIATLLMAGFDTLELLEHREWLPALESPAWTLLWRLPILALVITARQRWSYPERPADETEDVALPSDLGSPLVAFGFFFPIVHYGLYAIGMLEPISREPREYIVFGAVVVFGSLAMLESARLRRHSLRLARQHREVANESAQRSLYLNSLIENSPLAIVVLDAQHRIRICNPAFEKLFGYRQKDIKGQELDDLLNVAESRLEAEDITQRVLNGEAVNLSARRRRKDGTMVDVEIHGVPLFTQDQLSGVFAIYQDIGDRLRSELALRESEERFRLLSEASFEGIVVSEGGIIRDANEQYAHMLGLKAEDLLHRKIIDFVAPEDHSLVQQKLENDYQRPYEHHALRADGSQFLAEVHGRMLPYDGGNLRVTAVRDITERKRLEEETSQSQKMEVVGRLAGSIAHDFNNILTIITGYGQLLASQLTDDPLIEMAEEIRQAARRASLLTQRLLDFSRKRPSQSEVLKLNDLLRGMEKMMRRLLPADIELHLRFDAPQDAVLVDPGQIEQMVLNLVINAGDAMPRGGRLALTTSQMELGDELRVGDLADGSYLCLEIEDSGAGMDEETLQHAFDPFFTTKERGKGTGLGLSTVYNIVHQNGGGISVDSTLQQGTTFRIFIPQVAKPIDPPVTGDGDHRGSPRAAHDGITVLVVEDEDGVRKLAAEYLQSLGYEVIEAGDGMQALLLIEADVAIDLVLTDMVMPELNGPEMAERALAHRGDLPILYMTGYADEHLRRRGVIAGSYILQKPFSIEDLAEKIHQALGADT